MSIKETNDSGKGYKGVSDYIAVGVATVGVGFLPLAPGTWGSIVGVGIYVAAAVTYFDSPEFPKALCFAITAVLMTFLALISFWSSRRTAEVLGGKDPQIVVIDEVLGQLVTFAFVPFVLSWQLILAGFIFFRLFDIWKPYPVRNFEALPDGIGICADDIVAGVYAGVCLSLVFATGILG
jgi:phosphatidylglycerophosphatase A